MNQTTPPSSFDESAYLRLNPDVAEAVNNQSFPSGWAHYLTHGYHENRPGVSIESYRRAQAILANNPKGPVPPDNLRKRVHGDANLLQFEAAGKLISSDIYTTINEFMALGEKDRILDFGCGSGRVMRYFHNFASESQYFGTDVDGEAISWCQQNLADIGRFEVNGALPPLPFEDAFFDFVYSISVFTHLPEEMQFQWLDELRRVTRAGGYLLLTAHGQNLFQGVSTDVQRKFQKKGFYYVVGNGTEGLPEFYQTSFHTQKYIREQWGKFFDITKFIEKGIMFRQDLIICRKPVP